MKAENDSEVGFLYDNAAEPFEDTVVFANALVETYGDPREFRRNLTYFVQAARNVTFRIQAARKKIEGFEDWYGPWVAYMMADPLLNWIKEARNTVTKSEGIYAQSRVLIEVNFSYFDRPIVRADVEPERSDADILAEVCDGLPSTILSNATIRLERRWEIDDLPGLDVVEALESALEKYAAVLSSFKELISSGSAPTGPAESVAQLTESFGLSGGLPGGDWYRASTGERVGTAIVDVLQSPQEEHGEGSKDADIPPEALALLGVARSRDLAVSANANFELAKLLMERQGCYAFTVLLRNYQGKIWYPVFPQFEDRAEKYLLMERIADSAVLEGSDAVIAISESWVYEPEDWQEVFSGSEVEPFDEVLSLCAAASDGSESKLVCPIIRDGDSVSCGPTEALQAIDPILWPFRRRWGLEVDEDLEAASERLGRAQPPSDPEA